MYWKKINLIFTIIFASTIEAQSISSNTENNSTIIEETTQAVEGAINNEYCWSLAYGYPCCKETTTVLETDESGTWGYENNSWCGIDDLYEENKDNCWASILNYPCCEGNKIIEIDEYGSWGYEFGQWCGIKQSNITDPTNDKTKKCWSVKYGYPCCLGTKVIATDYNGDWGYENNKWCGIPKTVIPKPEYTVIYADTDSLPNTTGDYSWSADISYNDNCMSANIKENSWGALSIKYENGNFKKGSLRFDIKSSFENAPINVSAQLYETEEAIVIAKVAASTEWTTITVDVNFDEYNRFFFQVGSNAEQTISIRNVVYSTGTAADFTYGTVVGGNNNDKNKIITIYGSEEYFPKAYSNWSWETDVWFDGEMIVTTDPSSEKDNQASLSIYSPIAYSNGAISFDIKAPVEGSIINVSVFETDTNAMIPVGQVIATEEYKTYVFDIKCDSFLRFNFQDESGEGIEFRLKNILYTTGSSTDF